MSVTPNRVTCADALAWCRGLPDASVDVWWSSPPYNLADPFRSGGSAKPGRRRPQMVYADGEAAGDGLLMPEDEYQAEQVAVLTEWHRTLRPDGVAFYSHKVRIKGGRAISPLEWLYRTPFVLLQEVVWDRGGTPQVDTCRFLPVSERVYVLTRRPFLKLANLYRLPDVLRILPVPHRRAETGHPCPTHPAIVRACLSVVPRSLDGRRLLVADCFAGTGTTGVLARELGMDYLLCDRVPAYVALMERRLAAPAAAALPLEWEAAGE